MALSDRDGRRFDRVVAPSIPLSRWGIDLYWIPLGAGGSGFVRLNGRIYETLAALRGRRRRLDIYHTALEVHVPEGRFVVETMWPRPDGDSDSRGVVLDGDVWGSVLGRSRIFRYEVRCWRDGVLPDAGEAVGGPRRVSDGDEQARSLLAAADSVPALVWGRDEMGTGEMWNSNSVISWLLVQSGVPMGSIRPPEIGRAPGWDAGIAVAAGRRLQTHRQVFSP